MEIEKSESPIIITTTIQKPLHTKSRPLLQRLLQLQHPLGLIHKSHLSCPVLEPGKRLLERSRVQPWMDQPRLPITRFGHSVFEFWSFAQDVGILLEVKGLAEKKTLAGGGGSAGCADLHGCEVTDVDLSDSVSPGSEEGIKLRLAKGLTKAGNGVDGTVSLEPLQIG